MRLMTFTDKTDTRLALEQRDRVAFPDEQIKGFPRLHSVLDLIVHPQRDHIMSRMRHGLDSDDWRWHDYDKGNVLAPIPRPPKNIMCLGWNYAEHAQESMNTKGVDAELPEYPIVFTKSPTSVAAPFQKISCHSDVTSQLDWEVELAVVIGTGGTHISEDKALAHVFGYTVVNDLSARDLQFRHKQYFLGKSLDGACPMGPVLVTCDEIIDVQNLRLCSWVNQQLKQDSTTSYQIFSVARTIAIISSMVRLEPGDVIATGTPSGVGFARNPPEFLRPGDQVECEIEAIGRLSNIME